MLCALAALALLAGCGRARVTTEIHPDGSWVRTVTLTGNEKKEGQMTPSLEEVFAVPAGADWKTKRDKKGEEVVLTATRTLAAGAVSKGDLAIQGGEPGKLDLTTEGTVTRAGPKRFEYKETIRWTGDKPKDFGNVKPADLAEIKAALPAPLSTDANAQALAEKGAALMIPLLFGPGDPLLALGIMHPDLAERRASQMMGVVLLKALEEQFGDKLKPEQRRAVARKLIEKGLSNSKPSQPDPSAGPPDKGGKGSFVPLMFVLKVPGRVISSNGQVDELTGEVYWAMFPEAAVLKELTLTAICELEK